MEEFIDIKNSPAKHYKDYLDEKKEKLEKVEQMKSTFRNVLKRKRDLKMIRRMEG